MQVKFKTTSDPRNVLNKTFINEHNETINAKRDFSIQNPVIDLLTTSNEDFSTYNYFEIVELNRSYFIQSIEKINSKIVRIIGETDYLETYRNDLLALDCYYFREIGLTDYGKISLSTTGEKEISSIVSAFAPELEITSILSVLKQDRYTV